MMVYIDGAHCKHMIVLQLSDLHTVSVLQQMCQKVQAETTRAHMFCSSIDILEGIILIVVDRG